MDMTWDGVTEAKDLSEDWAALRHQLADAARDARWDQVFELLREKPEAVNSSRLGGKSGFAPLHQAAYTGAATTVAQHLIELGAWRTLQNARGERPIDVAVRRGHAHLFSVLCPVLKHEVPNGVLLKIQSGFHEVIRGRVEEPLPDLKLRLPELEPLLELERPRMWFPVPGMYGGFSYWFERTGVQAMLVSESWCRVVGGSGQRHEITSAGHELVDEGFV
jgi:hypothetical protein